MKGRYTLAALFLLLLACGIPPEEQGLTYYEIGENIWHLEPFPDKGDSRMLLGSYQGEVGIFDRNTRQVDWIYQSESFIMDVEVADLEGDGSPEILFVHVGGALEVIDPRGNKLFDFHSKLPLYNVAVGNLSGDDRLEIAVGGIDRHVYVLDAAGTLVAKSEELERLVHQLAIGNLDDNSYDEILAIENRVTGHIFKLEDDGLKSVLRKDMTVPEDYVNWENPRGKFYPFSLELIDLDGDGIDEILGGDTFFNKQSVAVFDTRLEPKWISERAPFFEWVDGAQTEFYSTAFVRAEDINPEYPGKEIVAVAGGYLRIWAMDGTPLGARNAQVGFTDLSLHGKDLYLASSPNGDDHIYRLRMDEQWKEHLSKIEYRGHIKKIKDHTRELAKQVMAYQPKNNPSKDYEIFNGFSSVETTPAGLEAYHREIAWFNKKFPYDNLKVIKNLKVIEDSPPLMPNGEPWNLRRYKLDGINGVMTVEEILEKARWVEENEVPTVFYIGHSCTPFITLETVEQILKIAPNYCLGFRTAEDEQIEVAPEYFEHYFGPLTELCLRYGYKKCTTKNKGIWWMSTPSVPEVYEAVFAGENRKVMVAATEDSNSRTPEMNLMGRGGLWQAGLVAGNDVSVHGDLFSFNRFQQWEYPKAGHPYLRLLVAHTTLGMTYSNSRIRDIYQEGDSLLFTPVGQESTEIFYHMLGKGLVFSPDREAILGYSPLGVIVHRPPEVWLTDAHNGHSPERWEDLEIMHDAVFPHNGSLWGMTNTSEHAFQRVIFHKERQFGYQVPATPYGLVAFVPEQADTNDVANISQWIHTDGIYVWKGAGPRYKGMEAAEFLQREFEQAAAGLPFRLRGHAFMQTVRVGPEQFRLYLVDPGWVDPADREVAVDIQLKGSFRVRDILSGEKIASGNKRFEITVPAGLFRILEVEKI